MDYCRPAALTITFVISYFGFLYTPHVVRGFFPSFFVPVSLTNKVLFLQVRFPFNTITSLIFHRILTNHSVLITVHHLGVVPILKVFLHA